MSCVERNPSLLSVAVWHKLTTSKFCALFVWVVVMAMVVIRAYGASRWAMDHFMRTGVERL